MARYSNYRTPNGALLNIYFNKKNGELKTNLFGKLEIITNDSEYTALVKFNNSIINNIIYVDPNNTAVKDSNLLSQYEAELNNILALRAAGHITVISQVTPASKRTKTATSTTATSTTATETEEAEKVEEEAFTTTTETEEDKQFNFKLKTLQKINNFFNDFKIDIAKSNRFLNTLMLKSSDLDSALI